MKRLLLGSIMAASIAAAVTAPVHAAGQRATRPNYASLIQATNDFGRWVTYFGRNLPKHPTRLLNPRDVNTRIGLHLSTRWSAGKTPDQAVPILYQKMHLRAPGGWYVSGYRFHVDSYSDERAVETVHWLFAGTSYRSTVRLVWSDGPNGWAITKTTFLRNS